MAISDGAKCPTAGAVRQSSQPQNAEENAGQEGLGEDNLPFNGARSSVISNANTGRINSGPKASPVNFANGAAKSGNSSMTAVAALIHGTGTRERSSEAWSQTTTNALITRS